MQRERNHRCEASQQLKDNTAMFSNFCNMFSKLKLNTSQTIN